MKKISGSLDKYMQLHIITVWLTLSSTSQCRKGSAAAAAYLLFTQHEPLFCKRQSLNNEILQILKYVAFCKQGRGLSDGPVRCSTVYHSNTPFHCRKVFHYAAREKRAPQPDLSTNTLSIKIPSLDNGSYLKQRRKSEKSNHSGLELWQGVSKKLRGRSEILGVGREKCRGLQRLFMISIHYFLNKSWV